MQKTLLLIVSTAIYQFGLSQYCTSGGPSSTIDSNVESVVLSGVSGTINYTGCPGVTGVEQALTQSTTLNAGNSYTATIQFGTCGGNFSGVGQAWIDFNQNMLFEASESIGTWQGLPPTAISNFNFTVPAGATNGATRMRVIQYEGGSLPINPCASFTWGAAVDFEIIIQGGTGTPSYCSGGPTSTADSNLESLVLNGNTSSINYTGCPGVSGVEQFTSQTANLGTGMNYTMDVQFGTCGGNYSGVGEAWIDFNQNSVFEASESIGTWQGSPPSPMSQFNFTVPMNAVYGSTKMRVIQREAGTLPINPCQTFTWGSATDFNIEIEEGVDCSTYDGDTQADAIFAAALPYTDNSSNSVCYTDQHTVYSSPDVYYLVTPGASIQGITVSTCGSSFDTFLTVTDKYGNILNSNDDFATCGTSSQVSVATQGIDSVYIIVEGWGTLTGNYTLNITEATDLNLEKGHIEHFSLVPNPARSSFRIVSDSPYTEVTLQDGNGRNVRTYSGVQEIVDVSDIPQGIYFVIITDGQYRSVKKLIKQ